MWYALASLAIIVLSALIMPKVPKVEPNTLEDFNTPVTEEGTEVGHCFGTMWIDSAHIVWFGDLGTTAIKSEGGKK